MIAAPAASPLGAMIPNPAAPPKTAASYPKPGRPPEIGVTSVVSTFICTIAPADADSSGIRIVSSVVAVAVVAVFLPLAESVVPIAITATAEKTHRIITACSITVVRDGIAPGPIPQSPRSRRCRRSPSRGAFSPGRRARESAREGRPSSLRSQSTTARDDPLP